MSTLVQTIVSLSVLGIMGIIILIFDNLATPKRRGFFEKDQNLLYPYHDSTVKAFILHIVGILIPLCLILLHYFVKSGKKNERKKWKENLVVIALPTFIGYLFGAGATEILTMVGKYNAGRLRPHFFSVCKPGNYSTNVDLEYIEEYDCGGNSIQFPIVEERNKRIREVSLSFPSGHASFAFQAATFTVLYLQAKFSKKNDFARKSLLVPFAQIVMIAAAFFVAVSRVMDYKHHPTDVIAGGLIGTIVQILNCFGATLIFSEEDEPLASRSEESIALRERNENESPKQS